MGDWKSLIRASGAGAWKDIERETGTGGWKALYSQLVGYTYYKKGAVNATTAGAQTLYQLKLIVGESSGATGVDVHCENHCLDFPNDIRFTKEDGETKHDYWIEKTEGTTPNRKVSVWVKVASIPVSGSIDFYMYYRKSSDSSESNGDNTFKSFDDFNLKSNGVWCWFQDPRAIRSVGSHDKTYWGWVAKNGDIKISSFNHKTQEIDTFTLHSTLEVDDHAAPAILVRNDGHLIVFYTDHVGETMYYRISTNSEDISAWGTEQNITLGSCCTYAVPIQLSGESNKIYLFFRGGGSPGIITNRWGYVTSTDGGQNWSSITTLIEMGSSNQYLKIESNGVDKIYFTHTGHPNFETTSVYYFYYYNGSYYKVDGTLITGALPLGRSDMSLVYDATGGGHYKAWIWDLAMSNGNPIILFATFPTTTDHRYNYARWTGSEWSINEITAAGTHLYDPEVYYSGGMSLDHEDPSIVYLSKVISAQWEIQKWVTSDGGSTWGSPTNITSGSSKKNIRPIIIRNHASDLVAFWMWGDYSTYTNYDTTIVASSPEDKWHLREGMISFDEHKLRLEGTSGTKGLIDGKTAFSLGSAVHTKVKWLGAQLQAAHFCAMRKTNDWNYRAGDLYGMNIDIIARLETLDAGNSSVSSNLTLSTPTSFHNYHITWRTDESKIYQDTSLLATLTTNVPTVDQVAVLKEAGTAGHNVDIDWVFIRKYASPEPTWGSWGSEQ